MHIYSFEKLEVWQLARKLVGIIYKITEKFPADPLAPICNRCVGYGLQIRTSGTFQ
jgi:hypothetical protein